MPSTHRSWDLFEESAFDLESAWTPLNPQEDMPGARDRPRSCNSIANPGQDTLPDWSGKTRGMANPASEQQGLEDERSGNGWSQVSGFLKRSKARGRDGDKEHASTPQRANDSLGRNFIKHL